MAEEKSPETSSAGLPGGSDLDIAPTPSIPSNACWVCGEPVGETYLVIPVYRKEIRVYTEPVVDMTKLPPEYVRLHHSCHRNVLIAVNITKHSS